MCLNTTAFTLMSTSFSVPFLGKQLFQTTFFVYQQNIAQGWFIGSVKDGAFQRLFAAAVNFEIFGIIGHPNKSRGLQCLFPNIGQQIAERDAQVDNNIQAA